MRDSQELLCVRALNMLTKGIDQDPLYPDTFTPVSENEIKEFRAQNHGWMKSAAIVGFGVGKKRKGPQREEIPQYVLKVYVNRKLKPPQIIEQAVPASLKSPLGDIYTDVLESGNIEAKSNLKNRLRPAQPGLRIGLDLTPEGTLGCLVRRQDDDQSIYILSNCHIIGGWGMKNDDGDYIFANHPVHQPMTNSNDVTNEIARLSYWIDYKFGATGTYENQVDAAVARVNNVNAVSDSIIGLGSPSGVVPIPNNGMAARKMGFATGLTVGQVTDIDFCTWTKFPQDLYGNYGVVEFSEQIVITPDWGFNQFSSAGDSGSVVVDDQNRIIGLFWGGTTPKLDPPGLPIAKDPCGVCNNINTVFSELSLVLP